MRATSRSKNLLGSQPSHRKLLCGYPGPSTKSLVQDEPLLLILLQASTWRRYDLRIRPPTSSRSLPVKDGTVPGHTFTVVLWLEAPSTVACTVMIVTATPWEVPNRRVELYCSHPSNSSTMGQVREPRNRHLEGAILAPRSSHPS